MKVFWSLFTTLLLLSKADAQTCAALFTFDNTNLTIHFTDQSTHAAGDPIVSWSWNFDDGGTSTQQNPTHTFPEADRYDVNLTITTQSGCQSNFEIRIEICDFNINYSIGQCNAQGQAPVNLSIDDIFDNASEIDVILDGQSVPGSPFLINGQNPVNIVVLVPGNGLEHTIVVQSLDIETCGRTIQFTTDDCSSDCFLSSLQVQYAPGITHNVQVDDNFFSPQSIAIILGDVVRFTWAAGGHSTTSDATTGDDSWNSGVIGAGSTFDVNIQQPGTHNYYCQPHGGPNGVGMSGQILSNCPTGNETNIQIHFNATAVNPQGYNILWDNVAVAGSPFSYNGVGPQSVSISIAGDGMPHALIVRDVSDPTCDLDLIYNAPDCGQGGGNPVCSISGTIGNFGVCENSNVAATLSVMVTNGGQGFEVSIDGGAATSYSYSGGTTNVPITLPGDGGNHSIVVTDDTDPTCSFTINTVTPDCNLPCSITNLTATTSSGAGGPSGIIHTVNVEDFQFNPNTINITVGDVVMWNWTGAIAHTSSSDVSGGPNSWDSGLLGNGATYTSPVLEEGIHPYYCIPHGAPGGVGMSGSVTVLPACNEAGQTNVQLQFDVLSGSAAGYNVLVDGVIAGTFSYVPGTAQSASILVAGDGANHNIIVQDISNVSCTANAGVVTPDCSGGGNPSCMVSSSPAIVGGCINGLMAVALNVTGVNSSSAYNVMVDGQNVGTFEYANANAQVNIPGNGQTHIIIITDSAEATCADTAFIVLPDCSQPCDIIINEVNFGNSLVHRVDVQDFQYAPTGITITIGDTVRFEWSGVIPHTVTSDALTGPEVWDSGLLGFGATYDVIINTPGIHPYFCIPHGGPGGIGMSGVITVLPACTDNAQNVQVIFDANQGSLQGYNVLVDGVLFGNNPRMYDNRTGSNVVVIAHPADNAPHFITIQDANNTTCAASDLFAMGTCTADCLLSGLDYSLGNGRRHEILVRDFNFEPAVLQIELGDTIHFNWIGVIPHTVTSDAANGADVFNSGLLGQGSSFDLVINEIGSHPYYCIPHGAPGGIGMSGSIEVIDACADGKVFVDFEFFSTGSGQTYDVLNGGNQVINDKSYQPGGIQHFTLELAAQGESHAIQVTDNGPDDCTTSIAIDSLDCSDPCFMVRSEFLYDINFSNLEVTFEDKSRGNIIGWNWNFGDGGTSSEQHPKHTFAQAILYEVCLTVTDISGCTAVSCDKLRLGVDVCNASFIYVQDGLDLQFYNTSDVSNSTVSASWSFGDGGTSSAYDSTLHSFALGTYEVCITVTSTGCDNTYCQLIDLTDPCLALRARYEAVVDESNPLIYHFADMSSGTVGSRLWGFGDGQISSQSNPSHQYAQTGVYTVCLLTIDADGNCTNSDCRSLFVGTTGIYPNIVQLKKIAVLPNPVGLWSSEVQISGFDSKDIGRSAKVRIIDLNGVLLGEQTMIIAERLKISTPQKAGLYYLQVVSATNVYGAMVVVQ